MRKLRSVVAGAVAATSIIGSAGIAGADYEVRRGDTLQEQFPADWDYICIVNVAQGRIPDCNTLDVGQRLRTHVPAHERQAIDVWFASLPAPAPVTVTVNQSSGGGGSAPPAAEPVAPTPPTTSAPPPQSSGGWAIPESIVMCESGGNYRAHNPTSSASGAYQITDETWADFGGLAYAPSAAEATPTQQDEIARRIWDGGRGRSRWVC